MNPQPNIRPTMAATFVALTRFPVAPHTMDLEYPAAIKRKPGQDVEDGKEDIDEGQVVEYGRVRYSGV